MKTNKFSRISKIERETTLYRHFGGTVEADRSYRELNELKKEDDESFGGSLSNESVGESLRRGRNCSSPALGARMNERAAAGTMRPAG